MHAQSLCRRDLKYNFKMAAILTKYNYLQDTNELKNDRLLIYLS